MMDYIYIGKIVNTHALKGEIRILSNFEYKDKVFNIDNNLHIGNDKIKYVIETIRKHKNLDMVKFFEINTINEALSLKGKNAYILKTDLKLRDNEYLDSDIIGLDAVFNNKILGKVSNINYYGVNKVIEISKILIPFNDIFIENIDINSNKIIFKNIEGLIK
jgi:16S rRNA processing protein RimM